ncbi:MAG: ABC transporter ATP-binding protein [Phycisphaeraceae bacterium]
MNDTPSPQSDDLVRLVNVSKSFGSLHVLREVSLNIERGKTTVILGPSGTGKSVLLKHIVGLLRPDVGEVCFEDQRVDRMSPSELVEIRKHIGFLFQMGALFDSMTVGENVAFPLLEHTKQTPAQRTERVEQVLEMVGLPGIQHKMPGDLSGGQRKRVALGRAIVLEPSLVLYDEPTTGLDPIRADVINELIIALNRRLGITSIAVTHDMASANKIADRLVLLYDGRIVCDGDQQAFHSSQDDLVQRFIKGQADQEDLEAIRRGFEQFGE